MEPKLKVLKPGYNFHFHPWELTWRDGTSSIFNRKIHLHWSFTVDFPAQSRWFSRGGTKDVPVHVFFSVFFFGIANFHSWKHWNDGRNPYGFYIPLFTKFYRCQVVQDFFHHGWKTFFLGRPIFRDHVSFREGIICSPQRFLKEIHRIFWNLEHLGIDFV